jgi:integrase
VALALALLSTPYRYYSRAHLKAIAPRLYGGRIARQPELLDRDAYARLGHAPSWRGYAWQLAAIAGWSSLPFLRRIRVPTLVLTGDDDPIIRVWNGLLWVLLATAGLRVGEALELRWEDVDLDARRLGSSELFSRGGAWASSAWSPRLLVAVAGSHGDTYAG